MTLEHILHMSLIANAVLAMAAALTTIQWFIWRATYLTYREENMHSETWARDAARYNGKLEVMQQWLNYMKEDIGDDT